MDERERRSHSGGGWEEREWELRSNRAGRQIHFLSVCGMWDVLRVISAQHILLQQVDLPTRFEYENDACILSMVLPSKSRQKGVRELRP